MRRGFGMSLVLALMLYSDTLAQEIYEIADVNVDANVTNSSIRGGSSISAKSEFGGKTTINRKMIEASLGGNGDITSLLRTNPAVKFSNTNRQSTTMGEIDPAEISINGAKHYQNNFMIDGMNINNDIDPANRNLSNANNIWNPVSSASQGMAIDADLLESIDVYDSDVSAKYGGFTGGVIDAKTRDPQEGFHGKISMSHTRDTWTKYHIDGGNDAEFFTESSDASNQPKFKKYTTKLNLEGFITQDFGLLFAYTNKQSIIPLRAYKSSSTNEKYTEQTIKQKRNIDNYFIKSLWYATDRLTLRPMITYAPQKAKVHRNNAKDSFMYQKGGGFTAALNTEYEFDFMMMESQLSYSKLEASRDSENQYSLTWKHSADKDWGSEKGNSAEGALGDINQVQKTLTFTNDLKFNDFDFLGSNHSIIAGLELKKQETFYEIPEEFIAAGQPKDLNGDTCKDQYCSSVPTTDGKFKKGQFLTYKQVYGPGKVSVEQDSWAFYLEDKIKLSRFTFRPGVRFGGDSYMDKKTISPRFSMSYDVFDDEKTVLSFGKNRYHGRNIFGFRLKDGQMSLVKYNRRTKASQDFSPDKNPRGKSNTKFSHLNIPYDDETSFGVTQKFSNFQIDYKYIKRKGRDQITKTTAKALNLECGEGYNKANSCYMYTNNGKSDTNTYRISLSTINPIQFIGTSHNIELSYERFKTKTNAKNYDVSDSLIQKEVFYNGEIIEYGDLPVGDFSIPWTIRLTTVSKIPQTNLTISNFITYKGARDAIAKTGTAKINNTSYDVYESVNLGKALTYDARIGYEKKLPKDMSVFVNLDITNVLDRINKSGLQTSDGSRVAFEPGRQFWLEAGIKW